MKVRFPNREVREPGFLLPVAGYVGEKKNQHDSIINIDLSAIIKKKTPFLYSI